MALIGKYEILKELGRGASSTVYLAHDPIVCRQVAIKQLNPEAMSADEAERYRRLFMTEASLAGRIVHPYIAAIFDAVVNEEACYLVMEYVGGGTLERYCQVDNLLPTEKVVEIVFKCCHALSYAYSKGVIHRDIKPENILVVEGTDIKLSDFGAALVLHDAAGEPVRGVGSLAYMSPQQAEEKALNHQADIYSLGAMLYKMLTGSLPFSATDDAGLMFQVLHVEPPQPSTYRMDLPRLIDDIVMKSLAKELHDRYQTWDEFEHDLAEAFERLPREVSSFPDTEKFNTLRRLHFFEDFGELELWEVLRISNWAYYPEGTTIIREGDETVSFFIIISGEVEIRKNSRSLCTLSDGVCFGEMSGMRKGESRRRSASVVAHTDIRIIEVNERLLHQASDACQRRFDKAFLKILADRLAVAGAQDKSREKTRAGACTEAVPASPAGAASAAQPAARLKWAAVVLAAGLAAFYLLRRLLA